MFLVQRVPTDLQGGDHISSAIVGMNDNVHASGVMSLLGGLMFLKETPVTVLDKDDDMGSDYFLVNSKLIEVYGQNIRFEGFTSKNWSSATTSQTVASFKLVGDPNSNSIVVKVKLNEAEVTLGSILTDSAIPNGEIICDPILTGATGKDNIINELDIMPIIIRDISNSKAYVIKLEIGTDHTAYCYRDEMTIRNVNVYGREYIYQWSEADFPNYTPWLTWHNRGVMISRQWITYDQLPRLEDISGPGGSTVYVKI